MFFEDRAKALAEMWRVLQPGGRLVVATYAAADRSPGYAAMIGLLDRLFGPEIAAELQGPFVLGDTGALGRPFVKAGIGRPEIVEVAGEARFPSLEAWVHTDVKGWTLADKIDDAQYRPAAAGGGGRAGALRRAGRCRALRLAGAVRHTAQAQLSRGEAGYR